MRLTNIPRMLITVGLAVCGAVQAPAVTIVDLGTLGGASSMAYAINNAGQVVASSRTASDGFDHPFLYTPEGMRPLGNITGTAYGINSAGLIVGDSNNNAFLYSGGTLSYLPGLGGTNGDAMGINDLGQIVGASFLTGNSAEHAVVYHADTVTDLGALSGNQCEANGINNAGVVVGYS
jgi:probable HAF family extracellular repeat protein